MIKSIHDLIAAISPDVYCDPSLRKEVKKIAKEEGYLEAEKIAKPFKSEYFFEYDEAKKDPFSNWGLTSPSAKHEIEYHSSTEGLEPLYFWTLDFMDRMFPVPVEKIIDNFVSSPGSGHFSELGQKTTRMQEEAMKMLGAANQVLKSILNLVYDLKEMKLLLQTYTDYHSKDPKIRSSARLTLKQRWMDMVDFAKRGTTSLKQLAAQMDYVTVIDAFMAANSLEDVKKLDLNERVKRILEQRVADFLRWVEESEKQLRVRYEIEIKYLRSQVNTVKLYSRWIRPYLRAAKKLEQPEKNQAALVTAFNTILLEMVLLAKSEYKPEDDVDKGVLPEAFAKVKKRKYYQIVIVEFEFRGIPQRVSQRGDWSFGGRTRMVFTSYGLNEQELEALHVALEEDDLGEVMNLIEGTTTESLGALQEDIDEFLKDEKETKKEKEKAEKKRMKEQDVNPFASLFSFFKFEKKEKEKEDIKHGIKSDTDHEKVIRSQAIIEAGEKCFTIFDIYKRAHFMPSHPDPYEPV